jgi:recombination protein RecR
MLPKSIQKLIDEFSKLPGIGPKTASRLVFFLLKQNEQDTSSFADALIKLKEGITHCSICQIMTESDPCPTCKNPNRDKNLIVVVEDSLDALAFSQIQEFNGVYHVLGGTISPLDGVGPSDLKIKELIDRLININTPAEIIVATNPSIEGEATAMYIAKQIAQMPAKKIANITVSRLGRGLPMGADLEYADEITLYKSYENRQKL